jgi:hypothetical protein
LQAVEPDALGALREKGRQGTANSPWIDSV